MAAPSAPFRPTLSATKAFDSEDSRNAYINQVFTANYKWLVNCLHSKLGCRFTAEDIASEAFVQLTQLRNLDAVREPRALLTTISQRITYELWRRRDCEAACLAAMAQWPQELHQSPEERALLIEAILAIDKALAVLPDKARSAFIDSQINCLTYATIAKKIGVSSSMVRQYMRQALAACYAATQQLGSVLPI